MLLTTGDLDVRRRRHARRPFWGCPVMRKAGIYKVSQWLGHKSVNTTMIYAHLAPQDDEINVL